jgi:hypothetical protein
MEIPQAEVVLQLDHQRLKMAVGLVQCHKTVNLYGAEELPESGDFNIGHCELLINGDIMLQARDQVTATPQKVKAFDTVEIKIALTENGPIPVEDFANIGALRHEFQACKKSMRFIT